ncbi:DUF89 domain-containing protein [Rhizoctonia solani AG-1 IA]|uniref:Sugar phosphate phosphatase n=1 Tax=Thanatephorus cucumeris (strain AG1-IA) TaxID=983506 RepID=L8WJB8_THACA|nr:DUF89 domain-containing protein [Rhizoctonia solani AG-1 IA]
MRVSTPYPKVETPWTDSRCDSETCSSYSQVDQLAAQGRNQDGEIIRIYLSDQVAHDKQGPRTPSRIDPNNPPWPAYRGYHEYSFAHATMGVRLPTILGKAIDDVWRTVNETSEEDQIVDLVDCVERMDVLMTDLSQNNKLRFIIDDGEGDIPLWNKEIAKYFQGKDFMTAPWLFAETMTYSSVKNAIPFRVPPKPSLSSLPASLRLSASLMPAKRPRPFASCSANSLKSVSGMTEEDIKKLQSTGGDHLAATEKNILGNDLDKLCDTVTQLKGGRIDFVLPPYPVLAIADFLIQSGLASQVRFHGKRFAWFVSDVTRKDWDWLLNSCVYGNLFPTATEEENASLKEMGKRWKQYEKEGKWVYEQHAFWCTGFTFWDLHSEAPDLFLHLSKSDLVIFKGDLNHRKLTYDCHAPANTPFDESIGPMASAAGAPRVCSLRTIKSDVVVGLESNAMAEKLDKEEPGWKISGKYAVVLLSEGRPGEKVKFA